jgi:hypothetical protein
LIDCKNYFKKSHHFNFTVPSRITTHSPNVAMTFTVTTAGSENIEAAQETTSETVEGSVVEFMTKTMTAS